MRLAPPTLPALGGLRRALRSSGHRTIAAVAAAAVGLLVLGLVLGRFVVSPAQAAADAAPPAAGLITVPAERRSITNAVVLRGDARYDDPVPVTLAPGEGGGAGAAGAAVVTGAVPAVGATLDAGAVALEVTGRPVIVLPGELPVYRTLRLGASGPDVTQLKQALWALGIPTGSPDTSTYDAAVAAGVVALYERVGYAPPAPSEDDADAARAAEQAVALAEGAVQAAEAALAEATAGPTPAARVAADNAVREAERQVAAAKAGEDPAAAATATDALALAAAERDALLAAKPAALERAALTSAREELEGARSEAAQAQEALVTALPAAEVVHLSSLPRRVDTVAVQRGSTVTGAVMQVSGAQLQVVASASTADAALLDVGAKATFPAPDGSELTATVAAVEAGAGAPPPTPPAGAGAAGAGAAGAGAAGAGAEGAGAEGAGAEGAADGEPAAQDEGSAEAGRSRVVFVPDALTDAQLVALQGQNVRLQVAVAGTAGEVLAVPLAALTAGPGGESRVERASADGTTELVTVTTGLAAEGYAEITGGDLEVGDRVVVGR